MRIIRSCIQLVCVVCVLSFSTGSALAAYPIKDPLAATIVGTPAALRADLPDDLPTQTYELPPLIERSVPSVLEYALPLEYTLTAQTKPAPLVFIIAGTGAGAHSSKSLLLARMLYAEGYHVITLPSPTHVSFMLSAARHPIPGRTTRDVAALYRMMRAIKQRLGNKLVITDYALTGYSLGGLHAAFIAHLDGRLDVFNFGPVLLINPVVNLYQSIRRMDALLVENLPRGVASVPYFMARVLGQIKRVATGDDPVQFNRDTLYQAFRKLDASHRELAALVGLAFRLWLANMSFASDLLTNNGLIVPPDKNLTITSSLEPYLRRSFSISFKEYMNKLLLPYYNRGSRSLTREQLIHEGKLKRIADYLQRTDSIGVITNADDPILGDGDLKFLRANFGKRAVIFENGGHMGNLASRKVVHTIRDFFEQ